MELERKRDQEVGQPLRCFVGGPNRSAYHMKRGVFVASGGVGGAPAPGARSSYARAGSRRTAILGLSGCGPRDATARPQQGLAKAVGGMPGGG